MNDASQSAQILKGIAAVVAALAWPTITALFVFHYRSEISELFKVLTSKIQQAKNVKTPWLELTESVRESQASVAVEKSGGDSEWSRADVPNRQIEIAARLKDKVEASSLPTDEIRNMIREEVRHLVDQFESILKPGPSTNQDTRRMDEVVAGMRVMGPSIHFILPELTKSSSVGERLAAIAALQMSPDFNYVGWLTERFNKERPFIFFHAAVALRRMADKYPELLDRLKSALDQVQSFSGGVPDFDTVNVLQHSIRILERS